MNKKVGFVSLLSLVFCVILLFSCTSKSVEEVRDNIEISEVMARNRTGLLSGNNKAADWIELTNTSADSINLEGFQLTVIPDSASVKPKKDKKKVKEDTSAEAEGEEKEENDGVWEFPEFKIGGGESIIVFADKGKSEATAAARTLSANIKLPKKGGTIQLLSPGGEVLKEVKYSRMSPDQSLALQSDSTYVKTYWQSPGFTNTREGYEKAMEKISAQRRGPLVINEIMSRGEKSADNWVEIKNISDKEVSLSEYSLSKKLGKKEHYWTLPQQKLQPGALIVIQLAGNDRNPANPLQADIKTGDSETIVLSKGGQFVDGVCAKLTPMGGSMGRIDGRKGFFFFSSPSRNAENSTDGKRFIAENPEFDKAPGVYAKDKKLCLRLKDKSRKVHYTLDGRVPTSASPVLGDSLLITKGTVVRTYAEGDSVTLRSNVATATYLPDVQHDLAVMNISVDPGDMFDPGRGIYSKGPGYTDVYPHTGANFWKKWTRDAHVELFDINDKEGFSTDCGIRIFGGYSRALEKKSFRLKFRSKYGDSELDYDFFDKGKSVGLKDLVLRSGSQDYQYVMLRDEFFTSLMQEQSPNILTQYYRPVALYINAQYFGLYYMREKMDRHFVARKLNVPNDSVNIIMSIGYAEAGPKAPYQQLLSYVQSHDMTQKENYEYIKKLVDLEGLIDHKLAFIYSGQSDIGNVRYVRSTSPKSDKKWHFVLYDLDLSWYGYTPGADFYLTTTAGKYKNPDVPRHNMLINRLLSNKEFRALFLARTSHHMRNTFSTANTTKVFDNLVKTIRPEMKRNCERWPTLKYEKWDKNITDFREKFNDKQKVMLKEIREYLHVTPEEEKKYFAGLGY